MFGQLFSGLADDRKSMREAGNVELQRAEGTQGIEQQWQVGTIFLW